MRRSGEAVGDGGAVRRVARLGGVLWLAAAVVLCCAAPAGADETTHRYQLGETMTLWMNRVGPYHNPHETYHYHYLPFCRPEPALEPAEKVPTGLGEILSGNKFVNSGLRFKFGVNTPTSPMCSRKLTEEDATRMSYAVSNHYWYQMYFDDLPIWGMVGEIVASQEELERMEAHTERPHETVRHTFVYTHRRFSLAYNGDQLIEVNLTSEVPRAVQAGAMLDFTYSIEWKLTSAPFESRFDRYLDDSFFENSVHTFSLLNSLLMVTFLCGLVAIILLRTLRNDYARFMREDDALDDLERDIGEEGGWKLVHGDVFRAPPALTLYSALLGTGYQLALMVLLVILAAMAGELWVGRGAIMSAFLGCYALTSLVSGYTSGAYYASHFFPKPASGWVRPMLLTAVLYPAALFSIMLVMNLVASAHGTLNAMSIGTIVYMLFIWALVSLPLSLLGSILGRHWGTRNAAPPCRVHVYPRPVPLNPWWMQPVTVALLSGLLPFGSVFIELYFLWSSFFSYRIYYVFGALLAVFVILMLVTVCVTVVATYFLLSAEDYRWPWVSLLGAGSTAIYAFLYAIYYFVAKTNMTGLLQTVFYFGYSTIFCLSLGLLCGSVGVFSASWFVRKIYSTIKVD